MKRQFLLGFGLFVSATLGTFIATRTDEPSRSANGFAREKPPDATMRAGGVAVREAPRRSTQLETAAGAARASASPPAVRSGAAPTSVRPLAGDKRAQPSTSARPTAAAGAAAEVGAELLPPSAAGEMFPLTRDGIRRSLASAQPEIARCYAGWLKQHTALAGTLKVHLTIERDPEQPEQGKVSVAELLTNDLHHVAVEGCVLNAFSELGFEAPAQDPIDVLVPMAFNTERGAPSP